MWIYLNGIQIKFEFGYDWPIFTRVMALGLSKFHKFFSFPDFFSVLLQILNSILVCEYISMGYRSSSSLVTIDLFLQELWHLDLANFKKLSIFQTFLPCYCRYWTQFWYVNISKCDTDQVWVWFQLTYFYKSCGPWT